MKLIWKSTFLLLVFAVVIYFDFPTFLSFLPEFKEEQKLEIQSKYLDVKNRIEQLRGFNLALSQHKQNRILILRDIENAEFPVNHPAINDILEGNFELKQEGNELFLLKRSDSDAQVFISKITEELNTLFTNVRKIKSVEFDEIEESIVFKLEEEKRLSNLSPPINSLLNKNFDWFFDAETNSYFARNNFGSRQLNLGLDLQGGMYLDIGVKSNEVIKSILSQLKDDVETTLIEKNVNYIKVELSEDQKQLLVELDPLEPFEFSAETKEGLLENYLIEKEGNIISLEMKQEEENFVKKRTIEQALETIRNRIDLLGVKEPSIQKRGSESIIIQLPGLKNPARARKIIGTSAVLEFKLVAENASAEDLEEYQEVVIQEVKDPITKEVVETRPYVLRKKVLLKGERIRDARVSFNQQTNEVLVSIAFDDQGTDIFGDITSQNVGKRLAIVLDGKVQSAPQINEAITGGEAQISGSFTVEEASDLALVLRSGSLPAPIVINEERTVGASLGEDSIRQSIIALLIGFCTVIFFMIFYYHLSGIFSFLALIFNLLIIISILAYFQATLTLPGMAGIILTIGMAVDANVLIFERIRDEIRLGSSFRNAIHNGFQKATITILDSNITTIIAAIVLFQFGTGPIKGFAVTLSIGIVASMFTSLVVGKYLFEVFYLRKNRIASVSI